MPDKKTEERAERAAREGKSPSVQAGEFVREEMEQIHEGKGSATSREQAIAIGLSKARRAGVALPPPAPGTTTEEVRKKAERDLEKGQAKKAGARRPKRRAAAAPKRSKTSKRAVAGKAASAQGRRTKADRSASAKKGAATRNANRKKREEAPQASTG